jgi:hypothetical protein
MTAPSIFQDVLRATGFLIGEEAAPGLDLNPTSTERAKFELALQLPFMKISESMGNHDSKIVDAGSVG